MHGRNRPDYSPENRSQRAGKVIAIVTLAMLILGGLATLAVVLTRGRSGIQTPPQIINPSAGYGRGGEAPPAATAAPESPTAPPAQ
jgi:hypothetical protein